jgi:trehalose-6-phosphate synthase
MENPSYIGKVVFVVIGIHAPERGDDYKQSRRDARCLVQRLERLYPGLVHYEERKDSEMRLFHRLSLFCMSDILLVSAVR